MTHDLFGWAASRYDLHTPPSHYQHDHEFVLAEIADLPPGGKLLDVGCGTGGFLEKVRERTHLDFSGIDASAEMVAVAQGKLGASRISRLAMQELSIEGELDALISLSWTFNYCASRVEAGEVLRCFAKALKPGGKLILQVAHAENARGHLCVDSETGPGGLPEDVLFLYRFTKVERECPAIQAGYVYACFSLNELLAETHYLNVANVYLIRNLAEEAGFRSLKVYGSWRKDDLGDSLSPFLVGLKAG